MFTGLTNQVTSWMGTAKGEQEEKVPTPTEESDLTISDKKDLSPTTKASGSGSKLDMLSNVKTQIGGLGGWLGSSIPKLRKGEEQPEDTEANAADKTDVPPVNEFTGKSGIKDEDDNSSDTGGADSGPGTPAAATPTEDKEGQFGNVQSKALAGAKSFGSFLYSAVNKAGKTVSEAGAKIKESVEKNSILGEFNKEQEDFVKNQAANTATPLPPWAGCSNESSLKEECLSLSSDRRNFVRSPPAGVDFHFDYDVTYPIAMAIMEQDPNLEQMRYDLVPKVINEENFWKNYFYRISLICQANELSFGSHEDDHQYAKEFSTDQTLVKKAPEKHEFVSDTLQTDRDVFAEVQEGMKKLTAGSKHKEEDWEKELEAELQDYEVVNDQKSSSNSKNDNWEKEIDDLLQDSEDIK